MVKRWEDIVDDMKKTAMIEVSRYVFQQIDLHEIMSVVLHGFADASNVAHGANVYFQWSIRTITGTKDPSVSVKKRDNSKIGITNTNTNTNTSKI